MKETKKTLLNDVRKDLKSGDKLEKLVVDFAIRKTVGSRKDLDGVFYSKNGKHLLMASKGISGKYIVCEGVREIDADSFWGCAYLEGIELPEGLEKIGHEAFGKCISLKSITIPESVKTIGINPFIGIHDIKVESKSPMITCDGKAVYTNNGKTLISFISNCKEFSIPEGVECISEKAFSGNSKLQRITLPQSLKVIEDGAFFDSDAIVSIEIPEGTQTIGNCSFTDCISLSKVIFRGIPPKMKRSMLTGCDNIREISIPADSRKQFKKLARDYDERIIERTIQKDPNRKSPVYK